jgi:predicted amidohydrolase YtcJ
MQRFLRSVLILVCGASLAWGCATRPEPADLVVLNGRILTVDASDSIQEALAATNGRIVAVGPTSDIRAHIGDRTRVIDLQGRTATPGLIDSHVHFNAPSEDNVDLSDAASIADVVARVAAQVAKTPRGEWVRGSGWDEGKLAEKRYPTAADLDAVSPEHPVWLVQTTNHYGVANSAALKLAGIDRSTADPPAGTIDRDARGNPTGVLKESAQGLVGRGSARGAGRGGRGGGPPAREQQKNNLVRMMESFNREGMTGAKDPGVGQGKWDTYQELMNEGRLTVRIFALWGGGRTADAIEETGKRLASMPRPPASLGEGMLLAGGVKLFMDGSGGARTAWMYEDWNRNFTEKDTGNTGYPTTPPDEYREGVARLHRAGIHVSTHAIGDQAIDWVVDSYDRMLAETPTKGLRHGLIHANTPTDHAIDVMARLQREYDAAYPEAQATFLWWLGDNYAGNLGPERARRLKPFRTFVQKGVRWAGGSDYNVTPFPARYSLWSSVTRETLNGTYGLQPFGTEESIDIRTALKAQTIWAAHQMFLEDQIGSIEVGKDLDLAVWDRDLYTVPAAALKDLKCELTLLKGQVVFHDTASPITVSQAVE